METLKFKTNIKCSGCIAAITPVLDSLKGVANWGVDTTNPDKILTLKVEEGPSASEVISALKTKGYSAETI